MSDSDGVSSTGTDFSGDTIPTAMDPYLDGVVSDRQQSVLNELREDLCYDDLNYLNKHKEVEAIATLVLKEVLKNSPKNPWAHAAHYLNDPRTLDIIAKFPESRNSITLDLVNQDAEMYATTTAMMTDAHADHESEQTEEQDNEQSYEQNEEHYEKQNEEQDEEQNEKKDDERDEKQDDENNEKWDKVQDK